MNETVTNLMGETAKVLMNETGNSAMNEKTNPNEQIVLEKRLGPGALCPWAQGPKDNTCNSKQSND